MAPRGLIPVVAGLSPMEGAGLVHTEAQHIAKRLAAQVIADRRNLLLDVTMGSEPSVRSWRSIGPVITVRRESLLVILRRSSDA